MAKGTKKRRQPRYPTDDSYRRTKIGFGVGRDLDGTPSRCRAKRPSFVVEALPDATGVVIRHPGEDEEFWEEEEEGE